MSPEVSEQYKKMLEELIGTRGAYLLDESMNILGKVPVKELSTTIANLPEVKTIIMDGTITSDIVRTAENSSVKQLVAMESKAQSRSLKIFMVD